MSIVFPLTLLLLLLLLSLLAQAPEKDKAIDRVMHDRQLNFTPPLVSMKM